MSNVSLLLKMRAELKAMGDFENCLDGLIGEMYAIENYGMTKTSANTLHIDGYIDGKSVQVKTKGGDKKYIDSQHYIEIKKSSENKIDLFVLVIIKNNRIDFADTFERRKCSPRLNKRGDKVRYYLNDLKKSKIGN